MSSKPIISCLTATYGRYNTLREAVACFTAQTIADQCELIVLNNHPTPIRIEHPCVRVYNEPGYANLAACRNRLLGLSRGEFVRTWDDDDLYLPNTLEQAAQFFSRNPAFLAYKPYASWFCKGKFCWSLQQNNFEAAMTVNADFARDCGYTPDTGGDEHSAILTALSHDRSRYFLDPSPDSPSYVYRWGCGLWHISGSLGRGTIEDRTNTWLSQHKDEGPGDSVPMDIPSMRRVWALLCAGSSYPDNGHQAMRTLLGNPTVECPEVSKDQAQHAILDLFFSGRTGLSVAEFGRLRGTGENSRTGDGWSTKQFATHEKVLRVYSFDTDANTLAACAQVMGGQEHSRCIFAAGPASLGVTPGSPCDYVFIDVNDPPEDNLSCYEEAVRFGYIGGRTIIAVDDYSFGRKHLLIEQKLIAEGFRKHVLGDTVVFVP